MFSWFDAPALVDQGAGAVTGTIAATQDDQAAAFTAVETITGTVAATQADQLAVAVIPGYADLTGAAGSSVSTPDHADLDIVGDIDVRILVAAADWTPSSFQYLLSKWGAVGQQSWFFYLNPSGTVVFGWSTNGTDILSNNSTAATGFVDGTAHWLRVTIDVVVGANREIKFYTSNDPPLIDPASVTWTQLGATVTSTATSIFASTAPVFIGTIVGDSGRLDGDVYYAEIRNGIAGTIVADPDFRDGDQITTPNTVFTDTTGKAWTINSPASWVADTTTAGWIGTSTDPSATGTVAATQDDQVAAFTGTVTVTITGTIAATQDDQIAAISGNVTISVTGTVAASQDDQVASFAGTVINPITGTVAATQDSQTAVFAGIETFSGTIGATQDSQTAAFAGIVAAPVTGTIAATQSQTAVFTGFVGPVTFWQPNPVGYTKNPVAYVPVGADDDPPW